MLASVFQLASVAIGRGQETPPTIEVVFEIVAEPFRSNLSPEQRKKVEADVAGELAELCSGPVGYLKWQGTRTPSPTQALKVELRAESAGYNDEIFLQYIFVREPKPMEWPRDPEKIVYLASGLPPPTHKPDVLKADVLRNIRKSFSNEGFRKELHDRLGATVTITKTITFDQATQRCVLPLRWDALQAKDTSVLLARFKAQSANEPQPRDVEIRMAPDHSDNELKCRVFQFRWPPNPSLVVEQSKELNDPKISESLRDKIGPAVVSMEKYEKDFSQNTSGSLLLTPPTK